MYLYIYDTMTRIIQTLYCLDIISLLVFVGFVRSEMLFSVLMKNIKVGVSPVSHNLLQDHKILNDLANLHILP